MTGGRESVGCEVDDLRDEPDEDAANLNTPTALGAAGPGATNHRPASARTRFGLHLR